jgi:hypothetical protein
MRIGKKRKSTAEKFKTVAKAVVRRGRPPGVRSTTSKAAAAKKRGRGRPRSPEVQKRQAAKARELRVKLRGQLRDAKAQIKSAKAEVKEALKREKRLKKLFAAQEGAVVDYLKRWQASQLQKLEKTRPRRRRRRRMRI